MQSFTQRSRRAGSSLTQPPKEAASLAPARTGGAGQAGTRRPAAIGGRRPTSDRGHNAGFTLIEILVAFLIMSVGILGILVLFPLGILSSTRSSNLSRSAVVARSALDMLKTGGLADAALYAATKSTPESGPWYIPQQVSGADILDDGDGLIIIGTPDDVDDDTVNDVILCDEATAFSWNATVSKAVDASGVELEGLYAVQIRVFRNFWVIDNPSGTTATFTEGEDTVTGGGTNWVTGRQLLAGQYIRSDGTNPDGLWYKISAINSNTELVLSRPYYGDGDWAAPATSSGDYVVNKFLIAVYDTFVAARAVSP